MQTLEEYISAGMGIAFHANMFPTKKAVISEHGERTFHELNANSNKYANFLLKHGLQPGDAVAIVCKNRPEFLDIAIVYALINFIGTVAVLKLFSTGSLGGDK